MKLPTVQLEVDGNEDTHTVSYEEWCRCTDCGELFEITDIGGHEDPDETCPHCGSAEQHTYERRAHLFVKQAWWFKDDGDVSSTEYAEALREFAKKIEALVDNGWEKSDGNGENLYLTKTVRDAGD